MLCPDLPATSQCTTLYGSNELDGAATILYDIVAVLGLLRTLEYEVRFTLLDSNA